MEKLKTETESKVNLGRWFFRLLGFEKMKLGRLRMKKERQDEIDLEKAEMKFAEEFAKRGEKIKYLGREITVTDYHDLIIDELLKALFDTANTATEGIYYIMTPSTRFGNTFQARRIVEKWIKLANHFDALAAPTTGQSKPPLGVIPKIIWMEQRITELSRALSEYITIGRYDDTTYRWLIELYSLYRQRDEYLEENGGSA